MNLWKKYARNAGLENRGFSLRFEQGIDPEFRQLCLTFAAWLRRHYRFPVHLNIYIKNCKTITLLDGRKAYGGFRYFEQKPPYIRIPAQYDPEKQKGWDPLEIHYSILGSLIHELTHYFQWVEGAEQTESQANYYRFRILRQFCEDRGLPY